MPQTTRRILAYLATGITSTRRVELDAQVNAAHVRSLEWVAAVSATRP